MALDISPELDELIESGDYDAHAGLDITLNDGVPLYLATAEIVMPGPVPYASNLRMRGSVKQSLRKVTDSVELTAQNVDTILGKTVLHASQVLNAAHAILVYLFIAPDGEMFRLERLEGELTAARISETEVKLKLVSDLSAGGSVAANRSVGKLCTYFYKKRGCDSASPASFPCSKILDDNVNGCIAHEKAPRIVQIIGRQGNEASFGGMVYREASITGTGGRSTGTFNGNQPGDDSTIGVRTNRGDRGGRHVLPYLMRLPTGRPRLSTL